MLTNCIGKCDTCDCTTKRYDDNSFEIWIIVQQLLASAEQLHASKIL